MGFLAIVAVLSYLAFLVFAKTNGNLETFEQEEEKEEDVSDSKKSSSSKTPSSSPGADSAKKAAAREKKEYEMRIYVMKLFETLMKRPATDKEIDRYSSMPSENDVLEAVINDYKLGPAASPSVPTVIKKRGEDESSGSSSWNHQTVEKEAEEEKHVEVPSPTEAKKKPRSRMRKEEGPLSEYSEVYSHFDVEDREEDRKTMLDRKRRVGEEAVVGAYEDDGGGKCYSGPMPLGSSSRICLDRGDLLRRLESLAREASHLYHVVSMY